MIPLSILCQDHDHFKRNNLLHRSTMMVMYRRSVRKMKLVVELRHYTTSGNRRRLAANRAIPIVLTLPRLGIDRGGKKNPAIDELRTLNRSKNNHYCNSWYGDEDGVADPFSCQGYHSEDYNYYFLFETNQLLFHDNYDDCIVSFHLRVFLGSLSS
jgi:hypothetical protein